METGIIQKWVLVHDNEKVFLKQYNDNQTTAYNENIYTLETFDTEQEMQNRIVELGLIDLVEEIT